MKPDPTSLPEMRDRRGQAIIELIKTGGLVEADCPQCGHNNCAITFDPLAANQIGALARKPLIPPLPFPVVEQLAQRAAQLLADITPAGFNFCVIMASTGRGGFLTHVSDIERADLVRVLREMAVTLEAHADSPPGVVAGPPNRFKIDPL